MELSRVLDVQIFVNSRATEISSLLGHASFTQGPAFGAPSMVRHLRRRATSHNRYCRRRRPNVKLALTHKRCCIREEHQNEGSADVSNSQRPTNRAMRRRLAAKYFRLPSTLTATATSEQEHLARAQHATTTKAFEGLACGTLPSAMPPASSVSAPQAAVGPAGLCADDRPSSCRLESHNWHARRMHMEERWGIQMAAHAVGRCQGSRSFLHHAGHGVVMHDASYWTCLCLHGACHDLHQALKRISDPDLTARRLKEPEVERGAVEWSLMLHRLDKFPHSAIGPAKAMFVPVKPSGHAQGSAGLVMAPKRPSGSGSGAAAMDLDLDAAADDSSGRRPEETHHGHDAADCALWLWVHASAAVEARAAVQAACDAIGMAGLPQLLPLSRIELLGPGSKEALLSTLLPVNITAGSSPSKSSAMEGIGMAPYLAASRGDASVGSGLQSDIQSQADLAEEEGQCGASAPAGIWSAFVQQKAGLGQLPLTQWSWPPGCVLGMNALDPRLASPLNVGGLLLPIPGLPAPVPPLPPGQLQRRLKEWPLSGGWAQGAGAGLLSLHSPIHAACSVPLSGQCVADIRAHTRRDAMAFQPRSSDAAAGDAGPSCAFPMLLVRQGLPPGRPGSGWSVILPDKWLMPVWTALSFKGARPCGQLEWRWAAALAQVPCFPYDFPHTTAGAAWLHGERKRHERDASMRPLGRARKVSAAAYAPWAWGVGSQMQVVGPDGRRPLVAPQPLLPRPCGGSSTDRQGRLPDGLEQSKETAVTSCNSSVERDGRSARGHVVCMTVPPRSPVQVAAPGCSSHPRMASDCMGNTGSMEACAAGPQPRSRVERKCLRLLERALKAQGRPPPLRPQSAPKAAEVVVAPGGRCKATAAIVGQELPADRLTSHPLVLSYVNVRVLRRGRCEEGATLLYRCPTSVCGGQVSQPRLGPSVASGAPSGKADFAAAAIPSEGTRFQVVGYVTSAYPRGVPGGVYPGGTALCDLKPLLAAAAGNDFGEGQQGTWILRRFKVWIRNPNSSVLREAQICCHDTSHEGIVTR